MDETVVGGVLRPAHHIRALLVARDAAEASRWSVAASERSSLHITPVASLDELRAALPERRFDVVVAGVDIPDAPVRAILRELAAHGEDLPAVVVGDVDGDAAGNLIELGALDVIAARELDRLGPALVRAVRVATISRALRQARGELHRLRATSSDAGVHQMLAQLPALVWTTDANLVVTAMHGMPGGAAIGDATFVGMRIGTSDAYGSQEDRSVALHAHRQALAGESALYELEWGGRARHARVDALRDTGGAIVGTIGIAVDLPESGTDGRIAHLATHDLLTDLPNRTLFEIRLGATIAADHRDRCTAVVFLDIDRFVSVNELVSHAGGDEVIRSLAYRLRRTAGENDVVSRFGGDKFVVLLAERESPEAALAAADALLAAVRPMMVIAERELVLTASAGISLFPEDAETVPGLITSAEAAMYEAKRMGRNMVRRYAPSMMASPSERLVLQRDLQNAIARDELELYYQPMYDIASREITGVEALVRWRHPDHGLLLPDRFIPIAEECGAIDAIGDWVMGRACEQIRDWKEAGIPKVRVSVNVSARQFEKSDLLDRIYGHVQRCMIPPSSLEIEVTESSIMRDVPTAIRALCDLKEIGLRVSIDDFGTGYTSLRFLKRFPVDVLKIDRSFIRDVATGVFDGAIVRAVTTLARSLGVVTIAEGVEMQAQFDRLRDLDCDEVQGFLFSRPMTVAECTPLLLGRRYSGL